MPDGPIYVDTPLPFDSGAWHPRRDGVPELLRRMRRLASREGESLESKAEVFRQQALMMQDYEDDTPWIGGFNRYFPTYNDLTLRQLQGYFAWRTKLRKGIVEPISTSAAYIYVYELLNGAGAASPEDALRKMLNFEAAYVDSGIGDIRMKRNLRRWMFEYAVTNALPPEITMEVADANDAAWDGALAALKDSRSRSDSDVAAALCELGGRKIACSPVLSTEHEEGRHLLAEMWRSAADEPELKLFSACFGKRRTRRWHPLANAVCTQENAPEEVEYTLNECRCFRRKNGLWQIASYEKISFDRARFQGFLHEADARLRAYLKMGRNLKSDPLFDWAVPVIEAVIRRHMQDKLEAARPKIEIDVAGLEQIRRDAMSTRESLLTQEELEEEALDEASVPCAAEEATVPSSLDATAKEILRRLLHGEDARDVLRDSHLMPSIAADSINEALFDIIGDNVVECDGSRLSLVEDYVDDVAALLGGKSDG